MPEQKSTKLISLSLHLTEDLGLRAITFNSNDTSLPNDTKTLERIAFAILQSIYSNRPDLELQDILNQFDIKRQE